MLGPLRLALLALPLAAAAAPLRATPAPAETFLLRHGGQVRGEWVNRQTPPPGVFIIRTRDGGEVRLDRAQVGRILDPPPHGDAYDTLRLTSPDTPDGHANMAQWCADHGLDRKRALHLQRILELDPDHNGARRSLGYRRVGDQWMTRDEEMASRGFRRYRGRYLTEQHITMRERERKNRAAEKGWYKTVKRWRGWLTSRKPEKIEQARMRLRALRDPWAASALTQYLQEEEYPQLRLLWIEALGRIAVQGGGEGNEGEGRPITSPLALQTLVDQSLDDPVREVRLSCLDHLVEFAHPEVARRYYTALKSKQNEDVNRAAVALQAIGNPEAIGPLIDSLVTTHKIKIGDGGPPGQTSASFDPAGGGGMSFGRGGPKTVKRVMPNHDVLGALVALSGQNFEFRVEDWNAWYASHRRSDRIDARRD